MRLQRKTALDTGAARGIGRRIVEQLAREGVAVVVADVNLAGAEETAAAMHRETSFVPVPLSD